MPRQEIETLEEDVGKDTVEAVDSKIDEMNEGLNGNAKPLEANGEIPQATPLDSDIKQ